MGPVLNADHSGLRKIDKALISLLSISRTPRIEAAERSPSPSGRGRDPRKAREGEGLRPRPSEAPPKPLGTFRLPPNPLTLPPLRGGPRPLPRERVMAARQSKVTLIARGCKLLLLNTLYLDVRRGSGSRYHPCLNSTKDVTPAGPGPGIARNDFATYR